MLAAAAVGGLVAAAAGAWLLLRQPWVLAFATLACIPVRIPFDIGDEDANLLFPLYAVVGALALALGWQLLRGDERSRELGPLAWPLAAVVAWTGVALLWTDDLRQGAIFLAAFVLPFGLLAIGFARLPFSRRALLGALRRPARDGARLRRRRALPVGDARGLLEPEAAGRQRLRAVLPRQLGLLGSLDLRPLSRRRDPRDAGARPARRARTAGSPAGSSAIAAVWVGLLFSFSQSSFAALIAGTLAAAAVVWRWRAAAALAALAVVLVSVGFATPQVRHELLQESRAGLNAVTSDRAGLVVERSPDRRRQPARRASAPAASSARTPSGRA